MKHSLRTPGPRRQAIANVAIFAVALLVGSSAEAQIKQPGAHARYSVELEPHALLWWQDHSRDYWDDHAGLGLGLRASVPIVDNGFVPSINNSVAIGFGLDLGR